MMYTIYDYSILVEPKEDRARMQKPLFSTDPQAYLSILNFAVNTSLPELSRKIEKGEFTRG